MDSADEVEVDAVLSSVVDVADAANSDVFDEDGAVNSDVVDEEAETSDVVAAEADTIVGNVFVAVIEDVPADRGNVEVGVPTGKDVGVKLE